MPFLKNKGMNWLKKETDLRLDRFWSLSLFFLPFSWSRKFRSSSSNAV